MDFELVMGLLGPTQNVSLYQIGDPGDTWGTSGHYSSVFSSSHPCFSCRQMKHLLLHSMTHTVHSPVWHRVGAFGLGYIALPRSS